MEKSLLQVIGSSKFKKSKFHRSSPKIWIIFNLVGSHFLIEVQEKISLINSAFGRERNSQFKDQKMKIRGD